MLMLTLDSVGYERDPSRILDRVMRNFFVANYSQTNLHYGEIKSLPYLIAQYGEDFFGLTDATKSALNRMLRGYFDNVEIEIKIQPTEEGSEIGQEMLVDITVYRGGQAYSAGRLLTMVKDRISKIVEV